MRERERETRAETIDMAINIAHRPDLDERVEYLAKVLHGGARGSKVKVIESAIEALEEKRGVRKCSPEEIRAALTKLAERGPELRAEALAADPTLDPDRPLSETLFEKLYDERGLPK